MSSAKRRQPSRDSNSPAPASERQAVLLRGFRADLVYWISTNPRMALRIMRVVEEVLKDPYSGIGKPEPLKHDRAGDWSRRLTEEDRIVYTVAQVGIYFSRARGHYGSR